MIIRQVKYKEKSKTKMYLGEKTHCQFVVLPKKEVYSQFSLVLPTSLSRAFSTLPSGKHSVLQKPPLHIHSHVQRTCLMSNVENTSWQEWTRISDNLAHFSASVCWQKWPRRNSGLIPNFFLFHLFLKYTKAKNSVS